MYQKELAKTFMMIFHFKKTCGFHGLFENISVL